MRHLVIVLGDQLDRKKPALEGSEQNSTGLKA